MVYNQTRENVVVAIAILYSQVYILLALFLLLEVKVLHS